MQRFDMVAELANSENWPTCTASERETAKTYLKKKKKEKKKVHANELTNQILSSWRSFIPGGHMQIWSKMYTL